MFQKLVVGLAILGSAVFCAQANADIYDVDTSGVSEFQFIADIFTDTENYITANIVNDIWEENLPRTIVRDFQKIQISTEIAELEGGTIADAQILSSLSVDTPFWKRGISQTAHIRVNRAFIEDGSFSNEDWFWILTHETFHALGFSPTMWDLNDLTQGTEFVGQNALAAYREESEDKFARGIALEAQGGGGSAGAHWEDSLLLFNDPRRRIRDVMAAFFDPSFSVMITQTTIKALQDTNLTLTDEGWTDDSIPPGTWWKRESFGRNGSSDGFSSVPEPSSAALLALALGAVGMKRRRRQA